MKRAALLLLLIAFSVALVPALAHAQEAAAPQPTTTAAPVSAPATSALITLPEPAPIVSAQEAYDSTEWMKSGDGLNLIVALLSVGAIGALVVWGIVAQRRVAKA